MSRPRMKPLEQQVVVVTGASSGIGLATARLAAQRGASVVLVSRNEPELARIEAQIRAAGGRASHVAADVADRERLRAVVEHCVREHGGFDTWVNDASVSVFGELLGVPLEDHRRLFEVNFWGVVHGSKLAAEHLRARGGGTIVNVGSMLSERAVPLLGTYSASKHAVKAFTEALRMELEKEGSGVAVTLIEPASVATPFAEHARNHMDSGARVMGPLYAPEVVARAIVACMERPRPRLVVGGAALALLWAEKLAPRLLDHLFRRSAPLLQRRGEPPSRAEDSLDAPPPREGHERGRDERFVMRTSAYTTLALHPVKTALAVVALAALGSLAIARRPGRSGRAPER